MSTSLDWPTCRCGCGEPVQAADRSYLQRGIRKGDPRQYAKSHGPAGERHGSQGEDRLHRYAEDVETGCWMWRGDYKRGKGYGCLDVGGRKVAAHRFYYEHFVGPIPEGLVLHHKCKVKACVNPEHLEPMSLAAHTSGHRSGAFE